jgi:hypothetical protein
MILDRNYLETKFPNLTSLRRLNLSINQLTKIELGTFGGLTSLQEINLSENKLTTIHPETFNGLTSLERINLGFNQLTTIAPRTFDRLTSLKEIYLFYNQLTTIEPGTFDGLTSLEEIHLEHNLLTKISEGTFSRPGIVNLDDNFLEDEPYQYNIEILNELNPEYIEKNEINSVYDIISSYDNLKKLIEIYPRQREIYNLFRTSDEGNILLMGKRIQLLADIVNLKDTPLTVQELENTNEKSIEELEKSKRELETIDEFKRPEVSRSAKVLGTNDINESVKGYLGGDKEEYKKKYMKYKKKYLELKENLM